MAYLINSDNYEDDELGMTLYQALSLSVENPEPWYLLPHEDKVYYMAAGRDFIRYLQRNEGRAKVSSTQRLWVYDEAMGKAKRVKMTCESAKDPTEWTVREGRTKATFYLGTDVFETKGDALRYGWNLVQKRLENGLSLLERLSKELEEDEREDNNAEGVDDLEQG